MARADRRAAPGRVVSDDPPAGVRTRWPGSARPLLRGRVGRGVRLGRRRRDLAYGHRAPRPGPLGSRLGVAQPIPGNGGNVATRHAVMAIPITTSATKPATRTAVLDDSEPAPSAMMPAAIPATRPPTWARQSIPEIEKLRIRFSTIRT